MIETIEILEKIYGPEITNNVLNSYKEIENNFILEKWKTSELDAGHFVESVRRLIELELFGSYTPFNVKLTNFNDSILTSYENATGNEAYRILIPRVLKSIYNIRNKRGVGHITSISPNEMDATLILQSVKWVLAELIRINSALNIFETQKLISSIVERKIDLIWKEDGILKILNNKIKIEEKILILLFDSSPQSDQQLLKASGYKNSSRFRDILDKLDNKVLISYENNNCRISPTGRVKAESIIIRNKYNKIK